jgi:hypothetical protein
LLRASGALGVMLRCLMISSLVAGRILLQCTSPVARKCSYLPVRRRVPVQALTASAAPARQARTAEVHIADVAGDTLRVLLRYCYGDLAELPRCHAAVLAAFRAADKYDIPDLLAECVDALGAITGCDDVAPLLQARLLRRARFCRWPHAWALHLQRTGSFPTPSAVLQQLPAARLHAARAQTVPWRTHVDQNVPGRAGSR